MVDRSPHPLTSWVSHPLQECRNVDDRPVWEPPILDYSYIIGEEYEQKRKAVLKYTGGDVVKTTEILDVSSLLDVQNMYHDWIWENLREAGERSGREEWKFWQGLRMAIREEINELGSSWMSLHISEIRHEDGTWEIKDFYRGDKETSSVTSDLSNPRPGSGLSKSQPNTDAEDDPSAAGAHGIDSNNATEQVTIQNPASTEDAEVPASNATELNERPKEEFAVEAEYDQTPPVDLMTLWW